MLILYENTQNNALLCPKRTGHCTKHKKLYISALCYLHNTPKLYRCEPSYGNIPCSFIKKMINFHKIKLNCKFHLDINLNGKVRNNVPGFLVDKVAWLPHTSKLRLSYDFAKVKIKKQGD